MKIAFVYGPFSIGQRPIDYSNLWDDPRGLTGSEVSCIQYARAMAARGHDVTLLACQPGPPQNLKLDGPGYGSVHVRATEGDVGALGENWGTVCVWNEPDILRLVRPDVVRLVNQQLNDWTYCQPGFADHVDIFTSPSAHHMQYVRDLSTGPDKRWWVLPNGCDPDAYSPMSKVPGSVLWASSPDRGLHLLLQAWPEIKRRVPHATLHCYYNFPKGQIESYEEGATVQGHVVTPDILELARRARYVRYALPRLAHLGVRHMGSVSRNQMALAMSEAAVLAYPCDTIRYTEGFSVTTMEACAAGMIPIISDVDALGEIYGGAVAMVPAPVSKRMDQFVEYVVRALTDSASGGAQHAARELASRHAWPVLAERLEKILEEAWRAK